MTAWLRSSLLAQMAAPSGQPGAPEPVPLPHPDLAPPVELPGGLPLWVVAAGATLVLALISLVLWLLYRPRPPVAVQSKQPIKTAMKALKELLAESDGMEPPEVGHRVSEILRVYFMSRYAVPALFQTTQELFPRWRDFESAQKPEWRGRFEPLADIYDELAFAPKPATHAQARSLIESAISKLQEERA